MNADEIAKKAAKLVATTINNEIPVKNCALEKDKAAWKKKQVLEKTVAELNIMIRAVGPVQFKGE